MKAIMYHYVRPDGQGHRGYLALDDFRRQLDYFDREYGFAGQKEFLAAVKAGDDPPDGVVLTFDDGLRDHEEYVLPELLNRRLWGIFYVATGPFASGRILDVHRIHYLLARIDSATLLARLKSLVTEDMLIDQHISDFREATYRHQQNDAASLLFKRILNFYISYSWRGRVVDRLFDELIPSVPDPTDHYFTPKIVRKIQNSGMIVGAHTVNHPVLSKLRPHEQRFEIENSFTTLDHITGGLPFRTFCYPYGGRHSYTDETICTLNDIGCLFSFDVDPRDITRSDLRVNPQTLPRYDCNLFPHGASSGISMPQFVADLTREGSDI